MPRCTTQFTHHGSFTFTHTFRCLHTHVTTLHARHAVATAPRSSSPHAHIPLVCLPLRFTGTPRLHTHATRPRTFAGTFTCGCAVCLTQHCAVRGSPARIRASRHHCGCFCAVLRFGCTFVRTRSSPRAYWLHWFAGSRVAVYFRARLPLRTPRMRRLPLRFISAFQWTALRCAACYMVTSSLVRPTVLPFHMRVCYFTLFSLPLTLFARGAPAVHGCAPRVHWFIFRSVYTVCCAHFSGRISACGLHFLGSRGLEHTRCGLPWFRATCAVRAFSTRATSWLRTTCVAVRRMPLRFTALP